MEYLHRKDKKKTSAREDFEKRLLPKVREYLRKDYNCECEKQKNSSNGINCPRRTRSNMVKIQIIKYPYERYLVGLKQ